MEKFEKLQPNQIFWSACFKKKDHLWKNISEAERSDVEATVVDGVAMVLDECAQDSEEAPRI